MNPKIAAFIDAVIELSRQHGLSIAHEDGMGAFLIEHANEGNYTWLRHARDHTEEDDDDDEILGLLRELDHD